MARAVLQRVLKASVTVEGQIVASVDHGLCILLGIRDGDTNAHVDKLATKVAGLRIFEDDQGKMNRSISDVGGGILIVSQFTLYADVSRGRRPSFIHAALPEEGNRLYERFADRLTELGFPVACGRFGAHMLVEIHNDGPVTIILDSQDV